jgi:hypothetical protein
MEFPLFLLAVIWLLSSGAAADPLSESGQKGKTYPVRQTGTFFSDRSGLFRPFHPALKTYHREYITQRQVCQE